MRTTLTIDDDLADALRERAHRTRQPFKKVVNDALRAGITARGDRRPKRYRLKPASLGGVAAGVDLDHALRLADALEDQAITRKLELRK